MQVRVNKQVQWTSRAGSTAHDKRRDGTRAAASHKKLQQFRLVTPYVCQHVIAQSEPVRQACVGVFLFLLLSFLLSFFKLCVGVSWGKE